MGNLDIPAEDVEIPFSILDTDLYKVGLLLSLQSISFARK